MMTGIEQARKDLAKWEARVEEDRAALACAERNLAAIRDRLSGSERAARQLRECVHRWEAMQATTVKEMTMNQTAEPTIDEYRALLEACLADKIEAYEEYKRDGIPEDSDFCRAAFFQIDGLCYARRMLGNTSTMIFNLEWAASIQKPRADWSAAFDRSFMQVLPA